MSSESKSDPNRASNRNPLPFEPTKTRKQPDKKPDKTATAASAVTKAEKEKQGEKEKKKEAKETPTSKNKEGKTKEAMAIPEVVSRRMVRRMAILSGIPTILGISTFFLSYLLVTRDIVLLPNAAVVLVSMGFFGLGVLGLSYGVLSASWEEDSSGSWLGWSEFRTNFGRMTEAWRSTGKKS